MTESSGFFGAVGDSRNYNQLPFLENVRDMMLDGYCHDVGSMLAVIEQSPNAMGVYVGTGEAWIQGNWYENTAQKSLSLSTADVTYPRIDRIILRNTITGSRTIVAMVLTGTPATVPLAPALTQTSDTWEICLAEVAVAAGATTITNANITDKRSDVTLCGVASWRYAYMDDLNPNLDTWDAGSQRITNVGNPSASTDATNLNYAYNQQMANVAVGTVLPYGAATAPTGYLICDGSAVSRTTYADLFAAISTLWGAGNGTTTFNLPNLTDRFLRGTTGTPGGTGGAATHTLSLTELAAHTHPAHEYSQWVTGDTPTPVARPRLPNYTDSGSKGGGGAHENMHPYIRLKFIIRATAVT